MEEIEIQERNGQEHHNSQHNAAEQVPNHENKHTSETSLNFMEFEPGPKSKYHETLIKLGNLKPEIVKTKLWKHVINATDEYKRQFIEFAINKENLNLLNI